MSRLPLVLAIEPDLRQAAIVKRVVKERVQAEVVVVDSRDAAIAAINAATPDVVLVSMLLSPRDEDDVIAHLRTLEGGAHLQTHTIPQLASSLGREEGEGGGLFSAFRRKKQAASVPAGCDPELFADEIRLYLQRAADKKREAAESGTVTPLHTLTRRPAETPAAPVVEPAAPAAESSWASPFEWRPSSARTSTAPPAQPPAESPTEAPAPPIAPLAEILEAESLNPDPLPVIAEPEVPVPDLEYLIAEPGLESAIPEPGSSIPDPPARPVHKPAPFSVWARKESPKTEAPSTEAEFAMLFARLGVPDGVASVAYPEGVRIRRVRVPAAKESHPTLHGAVLAGKRVLAGLSGNDGRA